MIPEIEEFEKRFGVNVLTCYGQSEAGIPLATGWDHGPWDNCGRARLDYPWTEVRVVNDMDEPVGPGVVGELVVRSAEPWSLNVGYYKMPEQTAEAWRNGWFHTGDAFRYDEDGWYYFADRMSDTIRRRGENISSYEVEAMVSEHPDVIECAAIGVRTAHGDDECLVHVLVSDPATFDPAELIGFLLPAHAPSHGAALRRGGRRRPPTQRDIDAGEKIRPARAWPLGAFVGPGSPGHLIGRLAGPSHSLPVLAEHGLPAFEEGGHRLAVIGRCERDRLHGQ